MPNDYTMRISRLTVDKLGVKLYDKVSAVIAELIANSYDADARRVTVHAPMGHYLAAKAGGVYTDKGFTIRIEDDGTGMTPEQMQQFFLVVGAERRTDPRRGPVSSMFGRKTMGRKGVGKLAPFGICKTIEVRSAGGQKVSQSPSNPQSGYLTSHIILDYDTIIAENGTPGEPYKPGIGAQDNSLSDDPGTTITLRDFNYRQVPNIDTLARQIAQRFGIQSDNWTIVLRDNTKTPSESDTKTVGGFDVATMPNTRITFHGDDANAHEVVGPDNQPMADLQAGFEHDGDFFPITGWVAYSRAPYRDDLMAGVRIYCRGKIAAQTSVFNRKAGFWGEHNIRSYLVGELFADWLDEKDDLIQTDRRDILWSDELGMAFQDWGQRVVLEIGKLSRDPMRRAALDLFFEVGRVADRVGEHYPSADQLAIRERALAVAKMFGRSISLAEAQDSEVVTDLVDLSISLAPHVTLDEMMRDAAEQTQTPLGALASILRTARIAELSSFGRIAEDRLKVIRRLETLKDTDDTAEDSLQHLIEDAPWLINPEWAPVIANQSLNRLRKEFEKYYEKVTGEKIVLAEFRESRKRPDFVLSSQKGVAQIVEIKRPGHALKDEEMARIVTYHDCMEAFLADEANAEFRSVFHDFHITLVCERIGLSGMSRAAFDGYVAQGKLTHINWETFLLRTETVHQDFLAEARRQHALISTSTTRNGG